MEAALEEGSAIQPSVSRLGSIQLVTLLPSTGRINQTCWMVSGNGVLIGAGVSILGPVSVGDATKIGAGSVVIQDLPSHAVVVGVPAKVIKRDKSCEPCESMDQCSDFANDFQI